MEKVHSLLIISTPLLPLYQSISLSDHKEMAMTPGDVSSQTVTIQADGD